MGLVLMQLFTGKKKNYLVVEGKEQACKFARDLSRPL